MASESTHHVEPILTAVGMVPRMQRLRIAHGLRAWFCAYSAIGMNMISPPICLCVDIVTIHGGLYPPPINAWGSSVRVSVHLKPRSQTSARPAGRDVGAPSRII